MHPPIQLATTIPSRTNPIHQWPFRHGFFPIALAWFVVSSMAQAVSPPPDGGYPGGNTAEGQDALASRTTGTYNTALGLLSLRSLTGGSFSTGVGAGTLVLNTADENTATGAAALLSNTTGVANTAHGAFALFSNTLGSFNTAVGDDTLYSNATGNYNTATGINALVSNTTGSQNTANGDAALANNTTADFNTAIGDNALFSNTSGSGNTADGFAALASSTAGSDNTAIGNSAGSSITGSRNVCIGSGVIGVPGESGTTRIRNIGGTVYNTGLTVQVDFDGKLGFIGSSRRYAEDVNPMQDASDVLFALKPVMFRYKGNIDPAHARHYGFLAEDVGNASPDLVVYNTDGQPESVRVDSINAMLLNEFLKEHRKVEEQQTTITELKSIVAQQQKGMEAVIVHLNKQDSRIQEVSNRVEATRFSGRTAGRIRRGEPAPKMVANNQ
jgi:uncharacterized coiled-coil protein SlyX